VDPSTGLLWIASDYRYVKAYTINGSTLTATERVIDLGANVEPSGGEHLR